jgi:hypothetical protein
MRKNVTFIDDLIDTDTLMSGGGSIGNTDYISKGNMERDEYTNQVQNRHIRKQDKDMSYAMNGGMIQSAPIRENFQIQPYQGQGQFQPFQQPFVFEEPVIKQQRNNHFFEPEELSCMTVANHIKDCPICSKFYNCDNSMYIVCIVLLIMVCVILLKKIIEK